jgi:hypothetical protein
MVPAKWQRRPVATRPFGIELGMGRDPMRSDPQPDQWRLRASAAALSTMRRTL